MSFKSLSISLLSISFSLLLSNSYAADQKPGKTPPGEKGATLLNPNSDLSAPAPKSVFNSDKDARDPFFPKPSHPQQTEKTAGPVVTTDIASLLRAGFQGIMGAGENRLAVINNAIVEPGRIVSVPVSQGGQQSVKVRIMDISKDSVVLEVQGLNQPLTLAPPESK